MRPVAERSTFAKLVDPPFTYNGSGIVPFDPPRWRYLKHACGENPHGVYGATRMVRSSFAKNSDRCTDIHWQDSIYALRTAYNEARKLKEKQDHFCAKANAGHWADVNALGGEFPDSLQWEALVDLLRGRVRLNVHCYEAVDFDGLVRLSNEFKFEIAAFHHAHEAYLVPDLLKKAYGKPPAVAIFATNARYKREAYRGSEFAAKILHEEGLDVVVKASRHSPSACPSNSPLVFILRVITRSSILVIFCTRRSKHSSMVFLPILLSPLSPAHPPKSSVLTTASARFALVLTQTLSSGTLILLPLAPLPSKST